MVETWVRQMMVGSSSGDEGTLRCEGLGGKGRCDTQGRRFYMTHSANSSHYLLLACMEASLLGNTLRLGCF